MSDYAYAKSNEHSHRYSAASCRVSVMIDMLFGSLYKVVSYIRIVTIIRF